MKALLRTLVATLLAVWIALPVVGGEGDGGENAGGTGVWILPRCSFLTGGSASALQNTMPRLTINVPDLTHDVSLTASTEIGQAVASIVDNVSCAPTALPVSGRNTTIPASTLQGMLNASVTDADILIVDAAQRGYLIRLHIDAVHRNATIQIY